MNLCARSAAKGRAGVQDGRVVLERMHAAGDRDIIRARAARPHAPRAPADAGRGGAGAR
jgi:hypothetical protein